MLIDPIPFAFEGIGGQGYATSGGHSLPVETTAVDVELAQGTQHRLPRVPMEITQHVAELRCPRLPRRPAARSLRPMRTRVACRLSTDPTGRPIRGDLPRPMPSGVENGCALLQGSKRYQQGCRAQGRPNRPSSLASGDGNAASVWAETAIKWLSPRSPWARRAWAAVG